LKLFCLHETGTGPAVWTGLERELGDPADVIAHTRLGWRDDTPEDYRATTIDEQAEDAAWAMAALGEPALVCGAGLGAVVALDLVLGRAQMARGAVLIEPPLLSFSPAATEQLAADRTELATSVQSGGVEAGVDLCLGGTLAALLPGTARLPADLTEPARAHPASLFAELVAVPGWSIPFGALAKNGPPVRVVVSEGTPPLVAEASRALTERLAQAQLEQFPGAGPAHLDQPQRLAAALLSAAG
jgi:pimeloyl-ACP methyl ester carboxylesterase